MASKRNPAIGGLHSQGIADDIIKGIGKLVGNAKIKKQVKKAYPIVKGTDAKVVKQMRREQLTKFKGYVKAAPKAQQSSAQKGALNKLKMETKPLPPRPPARTKAQEKELQKRLAEAKAKSMAATAVPRPPRVPPRDVEKMSAAKAANARRLAAKKPKPPMPPPPRPPKKK